jgi:hypothetical protein
MKTKGKSQRAVARVVSRLRHLRKLRALPLAVLISTSDCSPDVRDGEGE